MRASGDGISRALNSQGLVGVATYVWDTGTLAWVVSTGVGGGGGGVGMTAVEYLAANSAAAAVLSSLTASMSSQVLAALNLARKGLILFNDSTATAYVAFAATATSSAFTVKIVPGGYWEMPRPIFTGAVSVIWDAVNGAMRVTEL
jgi:uncharacterized membrane protein YfcA